MKRQNGTWLHMLLRLAPKGLPGVGGQRDPSQAPGRPSAGFMRASGKAAARPARPASNATRIRNAAVALGAGLLLYFLVAWLERAMGTDLAAAVFLEEACKFLLLLGFAVLAPRVCPRRKKPCPSLPQAVEGLIWGLAAIVVFATTENLAYFAAFPGNGIFLRLFWSEPVHLVSALAEAGAIWHLMRMGRGSGGSGGSGGTAGRKAGASRAEDAASRPGASMDMVARALCLLAIAVAWHLAFNLAADGPIQALEKSGDEAGLAWRSAILAAFLANLAALAALGYHFAHRVIVGGFLYGPE